MATCLLWQKCGRLGSVKGNLLPCRIHRTSSPSSLGNKIGRARDQKLFASNDPRESQESAESLFAKELKKRGMSSDDEWPSVKSIDPSIHEDTKNDQFAQSRALASEGFEGLIPRAKELLKLGASVSLSFGPVSLGIIVAFAILYLFFGENLLHGGRADMTPPAYVDPYELLRAESEGSMTFSGEESQEASVQLNEKSPPVVIDSGIN